MAVTRISFKNFMGKTKEHIISSDGVSKVYGKNGAGKSTIKQALAFAFTGCDWQGSRSPKHLISRDQDKLEVKITTSRSEIDRTLLRSGSGVLKVTRNNVAQNFNQTQFEQLLGSPHTILSCMIPEHYILALDDEGKQKVLQEVFGPIDRYALLNEICGVQMSDTEKVRYDLSKRMDIVSKTVAADRIDIRKQIDQLTGQMKEINSQLEMYKQHSDQGAINKARYDIEELNSSINVMDDIRKQHESYNANYKTYCQFKVKEQEFQESVPKVQKQIDSLRAEIEKHTKLDLSDKRKIVQDIEKELDELKAKREQLLSQAPVKPHLATVVDQPTCPTCGQTVGLSHRQSVINRNTELEEKYNSEMNAFKASCDSIDGLISTKTAEKKKLEKQYFDAVEQERQKEGIRSRCLVDIASLEKLLVAPIGMDEPIAPTTVYSKEEYDGFVKSRQTLMTEIGIAEKAIETINNNQGRLVEYQQTIEMLTPAEQRLTMIYENLDKITQLELQKKGELLSDPSRGLVVNGSLIEYNGLPYHLLSTAQRMCVGVMICEKLNKAHKKLNLIVIDDANLIDNSMIETVINAGMQVLALYVNDDEEVTIH